MKNFVAKKFKDFLRNPLKIYEKKKLKARHLTKPVKILFPIQRVKRQIRRKSVRVPKTRQKSGRSSGGYPGSIEVNAAATMTRSFSD